MPFLFVLFTARPHRPVLAVPNQPRHKVSPVVSSQQSIQFQVPGPGSNNLFSTTGVCNLVSRGGATIAVTMDQLNGHLNQQPDRSVLSFIVSSTAQIRLTRWNWFGAFIYVLRLILDLTTTGNCMSIGNALSHINLIYNHIITLAEVGSRFIYSS